MTHAARICEGQRRSRARGSTIGIAIALSVIGASERAPSKPALRAGEPNGTAAWPARVGTPPCPSWTEYVRNLDDGALISLLARARRIDPDGQALLRHLALLQSYISRYRMRESTLAADPRVQQGAELVSRGAVQARFRKLRELPPAQQQEQYRQFLREYETDDYTMELVAELRALRNQLAECQAQLSQTEQQLREREFSAPVSMGALQIEASFRPLPQRSRAVPASGPALDPADAPKVLKLLEALTGGNGP